MGLLRTVPLEMASEGDRRPYSVLSYHEETKHSELSAKMSAHTLDWENKPSPFKVYRDQSWFPLPRDFLHPGEESLAAVGNVVSRTKRNAVDLEAVAELLFFSAGLTRKMMVGPDFYYMRAASATGALYPIELYVISGDVEGLGAGV